MNNESVEIVRPVARLMANEMPSQDLDLLAKKCSFNSLPSGHAITDIPDA
jgi:hypothetical protein